MSSFSMTPDMAEPKLSIQETGMPDMMETKWLIQETLIKLSVEESPSIEIKKFMAETKPSSVYPVEEKTPSSSCVGQNIIPSVEKVITEPQTDDVLDESVPEVKPSDLEDQNPPAAASRAGDQQKTPAGGVKCEKRRRRKKKHSGKEKREDEAVSPTSISPKSKIPPLAHLLSVTLDTHYRFIMMVGIVIVLFGYTQGATSPSAMPEQWCIQSFITSSKLCDLDLSLKKDLEDFCVMRKAKCFQETICKDEKVRLTDTSVYLLTRTCNTTFSLEHGPMETELSEQTVYPSYDEALNNFNKYPTVENNQGPGKVTVGPSEEAGFKNPNKGPRNRTAKVGLSDKPGRLPVWAIAILITVVPIGSVALLNIIYALCLTFKKWFSSTPNYTPPSLQMDNV